MGEDRAGDEGAVAHCMPHVSLSRTDLGRLSTRVMVPPAVDADDGNDLVDPTLNEGRRQVKDLVRACAEQGRRRRLASSE